MTGPTVQQVLDCGDEQQLNEWAAIHCMGLEKGTKLGEVVWCDSNGRLLDDHGQYTPCSNKAQAFDFIDMYNLQITTEERSGFSVWYGSLFSGMYAYDENLCRATTKAAIIKVITKAGNE